MLKRAPRFRRAVQVGLSSLLLAAAAGHAAMALAAPAGGSLAPKIVNGFPGLGRASVGLFHTRSGSCSATLIGCNTALTSARCVCTDPATSEVLTGAACLQRPDLLDPSGEYLFFPQAGIFAISSVTVHPQFVYRQTSDLAVLHLASTVTGIAPAALNTIRRPGLQDLGQIVGFGKTEDSGSGAGLRRFGQVVLRTCATPGVNSANHLCVNFQPPFGPLGSNSGTCAGDFGGPFFTTLVFNGGPVLAGVASGEDSPASSCLPENHLWFADVYKDRDWVTGAAAGDLGTSACGGVPAAGSLETSLTGGPIPLPSVGSMTEVQAGWSPSFPRLRIALMAERYDQNDAVLYVKRGSPATPASYDCKSDLPGALGFCDLVSASPTAGNWFVRVDRLAGLDNRYEVDYEQIAQALPVPCAPSATTLCLDDQPGDRRFAVTADFEAPASQGHGQAIGLGSLGVNQGGLFWFAAPGNPELLVKVLNGCGLNGHFWVFASAGTNVAVTLRITDTTNGNTYTKVNPQGTPFPTIQDTTVGLPCP